MPPFWLRQGEAFGQQESLTRRLRHILALYPEGPSILSELVQNADDAGASVVKIMFSNECHGISSLLGPKMAAWQGPALYVFNDAEFTAQDFRNLTRVGQGSKLDKLTTTGRFGLGFNSVYHMTDVPSFVTGEHLVVFDPNTKYLPGARAHQPGVRVKFVGGHLLEQFPDQFSSYLHFGCDMTKYFKGTLFRFPLRTPAAAAESEISSTAYAPSDIETLLSAFREVAINFLLFLRNVQTIEVHEAVPGGGTSLKFSVSVTARTSRQEEAMSDFIVGNHSHPISKEAFYSKLIQTPLNRLPRVTQHLTVAFRGSEDGSSTIDEDSFLVCAGIGGGGARDFACDERHRHLKFMPWGGVAAHIGRNGALSSPLPPLKGNAFCFLPLPVLTGMPVHINALFELSSNRRDIWFGEDMAGEGQMRSQWNRLLLEDVIAPFYADLVESASRLLPSPSSNPSLELLPGVKGQQTAQPWALIMPNLFKELRGRPIIYTPVGGGTWLSPGQCVAVPLDSSHCDDAEILYRILVEEGLPAVKIPSAYVKNLASQEFLGNIASPAFIRSHFKTNATHPCLSGSNARENALFLFEFAVSDLLQPSGSNADMSRKMEELLGLPFLLLANGALARIDPLGEMSRFICTALEHALFSTLGAGKYIVADLSTMAGIPPRILTDSTFQSVSSVRTMRPGDAAELLGAVLPPAWGGLSQVAWDPAASADVRPRQPSEDWIRLLWEYICTGPQDFEVFEGNWPILPAVGGEGADSLRVLLRLEKGMPVIRPVSGKLSGEVCNVLARLGVWLLDAEALGKLQTSPAILKYVNTCSTEGVLLALLSAFYGPTAAAAVCSGSSQEEVALQANVVVARFRALSAAERDVLRRDVLVLQNTGAPLHAPLVWLITQLPVFPVHGGGSRRLPLCSGLRLAPASAPQHLLDSSFLDLDETELPLCAIAGTQRMDSQAFYRDFLLPGTLQGKLVESSTLYLLSHLRHIQDVAPDVTDNLRTAAIIRPDGADGTSLCCASALYDPSKPNLRAVLGAEAFPHPSLCESEDTLTALRLLGLKISIDAPGILLAARSIAGADALLALSTRLQRSQQLLRMLDAGIERILDQLAQSGDEGALSYIKPPVALVSSHAPEAQEGKDELSEVAAEELSSGEPHSVVIEDPETVSRPACEFVNTLVSIPWLARLTSPPDPLMPWCDADAFGPPLAVRPQDDAWLCSSQLGIAKAEVANEVLKRVFGWEAPISGLVAARQLVALSEQFADISSQPAQAAVMRQSLTSIIPRIYQRLDASENFEPVKAALQGARWIFVGDQFISADCVAFQCPSNTRPYLHQVPPDLACFPRLLGKEGFSIRDTFSPADYVGVLADLHAGHGPKTSLNAAELDLANAMVRLLAKLSAEEKGQLHQGQTIYAPGEDGVLYAACDLVYDDAPWLRASLQGRGRLNYVHADIATSTAAAIGVRSLREVLLSQQASTQSIPCPSSASLRRLLWAASVPNDTSPARIDGPHTSSEVAGKARMDRAWLCDVLEVAEELAMADGPETTVSARVIVDASVYGTQRLLQPALAEAQGPAVCVALDGLALSGENLMRFLALRSDDRVRGAVSVDRSARDKRQEFPRMGTGLAGLFHVTDILQVLTVSNGLAQFYILDPTGRHSILEKSSPTSQSVAKRYTVTRAEVLERFPDQFAPFLAVPGSLMNAALMSGRGSATVIRLPLRSSPGAVSFTTWNVRGAEHAVRAFFDTARSSFLFTSRLNLVEACVRRSDSDTTPVSLFSVRSHDPLGNRTVRAAMKCNRDWRRKGLSNMLKGYYAKRSSFELRIMCQVEDHIFADVWLISSILAPPAARDVANSERYQDKHLAPLLSCAAHIAREHAGSAQRIIPPPTIGGLFVGGDSLLRTGLPVHIDGPFFTSLKAAGSAAQRCGLRRRQLILGPHQDTEVGAGPSRQLACWEWNRHMIRSLCTDLLPDALADVANSPALPAAPAVYRFWPVVSRLRPPFSGLVPPDMHAKLASLPLYLSVDGRFVKIQEGLFKNQVISPAVEKFVGQHFPLFRCPHAVTVDLGARGFAPRHLTPQALRAFLRRYSGSELTASTTLAIEVLAFCLADALPPTEGTPATAGSEQSGETSHAAMDVAGERWRELGGVALLPLASGGVGRFTATGTSPFFVATSEQHILLPHIRSRLVSPHAIKRLGTWFENEHFLNVMGITRLSTKEVAAAACEALPRAWKRAKFVAWTDGGPSGAGSSNRAGDTPPPPSPEWIAQIWRQIPLSDEGALSVLREWPLLPLSTGELASCSLLGNIFAACPSESSQRISQRIQSAIAAQSRELEALDVREEARVRAERRSEGTSRLSQADFDLLSGAGDAETETRGSDSESDIDAPRALTPPACSTTDATVSGQTDVEESSVLSDSTSAGTYVTNSAEGPAAASLSVPPPHVAGATPAPPPIPLLPNESPRLKQLRSLMHLVHAPVLEMAYFPASSHGTIVTHEMEAAARSALHCLHAVSGFSRLQWESLTDEEMDALLSILVKPNGDFGAPAPPHALSDVIKLRSLPIWRTMSGQRVSLVESDFCILRPADAHCLGGNIPLPLSALDRVLHVAPGLEDLMTNMQVEPLGTSGMISRFALPEYSSMSSEDQNRLLLHIRDNWATLREDDALKAALGQVAFVSTGSSGTLAKPGTLLDPRQPVMAAVFEDELEAFPQGEFGEAEWLDVLADVGLRSAIDKSMFLTCAQKIQSMKADPLPPDVAAKARLLLVFLSKNWDAEFWSADFLLSISSIRFVRVEAPGGRGLQLVRFCDAAVPRDEHLCFSVMPVHSADTVPPQIMWSKLNISTPPSTDVVLRHIRVLSEGEALGGPHYLLHAQRAA
jgi:sacsin